MFQLYYAGTNTISLIARCGSVHPADWHSCPHAQCDCDGAGRRTPRGNKHRFKSRIRQTIWMPVKHLDVSNWIDRLLNGSGSFYYDDVNVQAVTGQQLQRSDEV